jgi:ParB family transcriptional regulator, chromosome partitioning protein
MTEALTTGELVHVDPDSLSIETNVRTEASVTKQFIASIKENGVLVPIVAVRDADGTLRVRAGQRRTLAAREAGLATVPVYVTDADADTASRVVAQITENDHRLALEAVDRVKGIQALLDTGLSMTKVAKRLAVSAERVKQSKAVAASAVAMEALHGKTATLIEAAGIAEFEDDPDAVVRLLQAAGRNYFDQELERLRQARKEAAQRERAAQEFATLGYTVLDAYPRYGSGQVPTTALRTADGQPVDEADPAIVANPQHWSVILDEESVFTDAEGNRVDETEIDWSTEGDPEATPEEGKRHADSITETTEFVPSAYFCHNPDAEGLTVTEQYSKLAEASALLPDGAEPETSADLARKAAEKAERRKVIALNKAGSAAETVRREFVRGMLKRKTAPDGAMLFVARSLTHNGSLLGSSKGDELAGELLGGDVRSGELLDHATDHRAEVVLLGLILGTMESLTPKSAWRGPGQWSKDYLRFLAESGYGLSPVEQVVTGDKTADECLEELS